MDCVLSRGGLGIRPLELGPQRRSRLLEEIAGAYSSVKVDLALSGAGVAVDAF